MQLPYAAFDRRAHALENSAGVGEGGRHYVADGRLRVAARMAGRYRVRDESLGVEGLREFWRRRVRSCRRQ